MPPPRPAAPATGTSSPPPTDATRELDQLRRMLSRREVELSRFTTERDMLRARVAERDARIRELEAQLLASQDLARLEAELLERTTELQGRTTELEELKRSVAELSALDRERMAALESDAARERDRARRLEQELAESLAWSPDPDDDLKRLPGVGPAFERALKAAGVRTFAQIAGWSDADVESIAPRIKTTAARIRRDDWILNARKLCGRA